MDISTVKIAADAVVAEVAPGRGGMAVSLKVADEELLYLDRATLEDPRQKVRGGIPFLFPIAGSLKGGTYRVGEREYHLPQHGFARDLAWSVVACDVRSVECRLTSNEQTLGDFPFRFDVRLKYKAAGNTLTIEQTISNLDNQPMPLHFGFHPYFLIPDGDKAGVRIASDATRAFNHMETREESLSGIDLTRPEVNLGLLDHGSTETRIERPGRRTLRLAWKEPLRHLVVWTLAGEDFVCVEPWSAPPNALQSGDGLGHIGPREMRRSFFAVTSME